MSKLLVVLATFVLLVVIALPGRADAAQRADGFKNSGVYEVSAQKRRYVRRYYSRRYAPYPYSDPYFPPAPYVPLAPEYLLGPVVPWWW